MEDATKISGIPLLIALLVITSGCASTQDGFIPIGSHHLQPRPGSYDPPIFEQVPTDVECVVVARLYATKVPKTAFDAIHPEELVACLKRQARLCGADAIGSIHWDTATRKSLNGVNTFYGYSVAADALYFPYKHQGGSEPVKDSS